MLSEYATSEPAPEPRPGPTGQPLLLGPVDEVGDDQEVAREAHLQDRLDLEVEAFDVARPLALALGRHRDTAAEPPLQAVVRRRRGSTRPSASRAPSTRGVGKSGSCGLPSTRLRLQRLRDLDACWRAPLGMSANSASICACVLKYCSRVKRLTRRGLASISPSATQTRASCASKSSGVEELHRMRRHHRQRSSPPAAPRRARAPRCRGRPARCSSM